MAGDAQGRNLNSDAGKHGSGGSASQAPIPETIDHYRVIRKIGRGGQGDVYLAHDPNLDIDVAVKVLLADYRTEEILNRFTLEARTAVRLTAENIVRIYNFNPGPATLPLPVLEEIQAEFLDYQGTGLSIIESSHRSPEYDAVHEEAQALTKELLGLGDYYKVLFLGGGASTQFFTVPQNLLGDGRKADYILTGTWAKKAVKEAALFGDVHVAHDAADEEGAG